MKIKNIKPSYPEQHWVDLNNYHINKVLEKGIKINEIHPQRLPLHNGMVMTDNKVTFSSLIIILIMMNKKFYRLEEYEWLD